jgi:hypothetical protein
MRPFAQEEVYLRPACGAKVADRPDEGARSPNAPNGGGFGESYMALAQASMPIRQGGKLWNGTRIAFVADTASF